ncbi:hypothetical protein N9D35_07410 [Gammaproteobacteria bacterium]|nr:hypothetical protein [Gammaproteobacteria bacterium]
MDPFILTVARDEEFTEEFSQEIAESFPSEAEISYGLAISLIGQTNWHATLLSVAGADGSYLYCYSNTANFPHPEKRSKLTIMSPS